MDAGGLLGRVHNLTLFFCSRSPSRPRRVVFNQWSLAAFERLSHMKLIVQISCGGGEVFGLGGAVQPDLRTALAAVL